MYALLKLCIQPASHDRVVAGSRAIGCVFLIFRCYYGQHNYRVQYVWRRGVDRLRGHTASTGMARQESSRRDSVPWILTGVPTVPLPEARQWQERLQVENIANLQMQGTWI